MKISIIMGISIIGFYGYIVLNDNIMYVCKKEYEFCKYIFINKFY